MIKISPLPSHFLRIPQKPNSRNRENYRETWSWEAYHSLNASEDCITRSRTSGRHDWSELSSKECFPQTMCRSSLHQWRSSELELVDCGVLLGSISKLRFHQICTVNEFDFEANGWMKMKRRKRICAQRLKLTVPAIGWRKLSRKTKIAADGEGGSGVRKWMERKLRSHYFLFSLKRTMLIFSFFLLLIRKLPFFFSTLFGQQIWGQTMVEL